MRRLPRHVVAVLVFLSILPLFGVSKLKAGSLDNWQLVSPLPQTNHLYGATYGSGKFVVVGAGGTIMTSLDGQHWTIQTSGTTSDLWDVTYGNNMFMAVGNSAVVLTSPDGVTWTNRTALVQAADVLVGDFHGVACGNGIFALVSGDESQTGGDHSVMLSPDGVTWMNNEGLPDQNVGSFWRIAYGDGRFVTVGDSGVIQTGTYVAEAGFIVWTNSYQAPNCLVMNAVTYNNGIFVAAGSVFSSLDGTSVMATSVDGINWTTHSVPNVDFFPGLVGGIVFGNNAFVATALGPNGLLPPSLLSSTDGASWTSHSSGLGSSYGTLNAVAFGGNTYVAVADNGAILHDTVPASQVAITAQPVGATAVAGGTASFSVTATGSGQLSYQWKKNGINLANGGNVGGVGAATLNLSNVSAADYGLYSVLVSDATGSVISITAPLAVANSQGAIPVNPIGGQAGTLQITSGTGNFSQISSANKTLTVAAGSSIGGVVNLLANNVATAGTTTPLIFTPSWGEPSSSYNTTAHIATGQTSQPVSVSLTAPLSPGTYHIFFAFQWEPTGDHVASATSSQDGQLFLVWDDGNDIAELGPAQIAQAQASGYTVDTWLFPATIAASRSAPVYVPCDALTLVVTGTAQIGSLQVTLSPSTAVSAGAQWNVDGGAWQNSGAVVSGLTVGSHNVYFSAVNGYDAPVSQVVNVAAGQTATATGVYAVNTGPPSITTQPTGQTVVAGGAASFSVIATGSGQLSYQWKHNGSNLTDGGNVSGSTAATLSLSNVSTTDYGLYTVLVTCATGSVTSIVAPLAIPSSQGSIPVNPVGGQAGTLQIGSGTGSFSQISSANKTLTVAVGASVSGTVSLQANNLASAGNTAPLIYTPSWGVDSTSWQSISSSIPIGQSSQQASVSLTAPTTPGTYYILFAYQWETSGSHVASATNWQNSPGLVWNDGNDIAQLDPAQIAQAQSNGYTVDSWLFPTTIAPSGSAPVYVPSDALTLVVASSSAISVQQPAGTNLTSGVSVVDYGAVSTGSNSAKTFTIKNTGTTSLTLGTLSIDGTNGTDFVINPVPTGPVSPGGSSTFTVTFSPGALGSRSGTLHIPSNDPNTSTFNVSLTGTGSLDALSPATGVTAGWATLNATVNPNGVVTTAYFVYGTNSANLNLTTPAFNLGSGNTMLPVSFNLAGLTKNTKYYYQLVANGTPLAGSPPSFTTLSSSPPSWHSAQVTALTNPTLANMADGARTGVAQPNANLYFYKGIDKNIWAVFLAGNQWQQQQLSTNANVSDWLAYEPNYGTLNYQSLDGNLWCVYYNTATAKWTSLQLGTLPQGVTIAGDLVVDSSGGWNNIYYRGSDSHLYAAYFNGSAWVHTAIGGTATVKGNLAVQGSGHLVYYQGTDNNIWCFYNNGKAWQQLQLTTTGNVSGAVAVDNAGLLAYYKSSTDTSAWCTYSAGGPWIAGVQLDATANMNSSATSFSNIAPYNANDCTLYLDNNGQCDSLYWNGHVWTHVILGDGGSQLTGGLSLQPTNHWLFARRSDGNVILFYYQ